MLHKTVGVVFKTTKFSETSAIIKIYTEKFGLQSYIVHQVFSQKAKGKAALYQHGSILDLVVYYRENGNIFRISEAKFNTIYRQVPFTIIRSSLLLFCLELLNKTIKEQESHEALFQFITQSFNYLDTTQHNLHNFHLYFIIELSKLLGFYPSNTNGLFFDLREGTFTSQMPNHAFYMDQIRTVNFKLLLDTSNANCVAVILNSNERKQILLQLLLYYKLHVDGFGEMKSPTILEDVFRN